MGKAGAHVWQDDELLADRYDVLKCLRKTATGCLYRVEDVFRGSHQLILGPGLRVLQTEGGLQWFQGYAQRTLGVSPHANVLVPRRLDQHEGVPFLVMPDAEGTFWDVAIEEGFLTELPHMVDIALQVARGLAWLHEENRVHYNVKPANVILTESDVVKLWKYGEVEAVSRVYASPEQIQGEQSLGNATDTWSWAASVLHMFVGRIVWKSGLKVPTVMRRYVRHGPAREGLPLMPGRMSDLVRDCLQKDPAARPEDMQHVVRELESILKALKGEESKAASAEFEQDEWKAFEELVDQPDIADQLARDIGGNANEAAEAEDELEDEIIEVIEDEDTGLTEDAEPQQPEKSGDSQQAEEGEESPEESKGSSGEGRGRSGTRRWHFEQR
ncbi:MAG: protein kinase [Candidatus Brocadiia bacterium]